MKTAFGATPLKPFAQELAERRSSLGLPPMAPRMAARTRPMTVINRNAVMVAANGRPVTGTTGSGFRTNSKAASMGRLGIPARRELAGFWDDPSGSIASIFSSTPATPPPDNYVMASSSNSFVGPVQPVGSVNAGSQGAAPTTGFWGNLFSPLVSLAKEGVTLYKQKQDLKVAQSQTAAAAAQAQLLSAAKAQGGTSLSSLLPILLMGGLAVGGYLVFAGGGSSRRRR